LRETPPTDPPGPRARSSEGERRLACAVIETAWVEYLGFDQRASNRAREWFLQSEHSFEAWCELAGLAPGTASRIRIKVVDTSPLWLESAEARATGQPEPEQERRQRVHAVVTKRGRPRKK